MPRPTPNQPSLLAEKTNDSAVAPYFAGRHPLLRQFADSCATHLPPIIPDTLPHSQTVSRSGALYNVHSYWSKKPYLAIARFIEHYTKRGGLVLDPFCGCGSTLQAALGTGRPAIGVDISPSAAHVAANTTHWVDRHRFAAEGKKLVKRLQSLLEPFYKCTLNGREQIIASLVHSEQVRCSKCLKLFPIVAEGTTNAKDACPHCGQKFSTRSKSLEFGPAVVVAVEGRESWNSKRGEMHWLHDGTRYCPLTSDDAVHSDAEAIRARRMEPVPRRLIDLGGRLATTGSITLGALHEDRALCGLEALHEVIAAVDDEVLKGKFLLAFTGILTNCSKLYRFREGGGGGAIGAYYVPPIRRELNPLFGFCEKLKTIDASLVEISEWDERRFAVSNQAAQQLDIPTGSVDYVFTDPPYADTMPYGALNFIWDGWLGRAGESSEEAIGDGWKSVMEAVFTEVHRVLKPGGYCSVCYHDTSEGTWADLLDVMAASGFRPVIGKDVLFIETNQKAYQQTVADKVVKRDHVINFVRVSEEVASVTQERDGGVPFGELVKGLIGDFLTERPGATKDWVYDHVITRLIEQDRLEPHHFEKMLSSVADEYVPEDSGKQSMWYLKTGRDGVDAAEAEREGFAAARLEGSMREHLMESPEDEGVHYSDLFAAYLLVSPKPRRKLAEWLPEYFFKTPDGTWRPPADENERQQKAAIREAGTLRRMKRFANALLEGVPVRDQDRPDSARTLVEWIRQCRRAGFYEQGRVMYEKGGLDLDRLNEDEQIEVEDDYRICAKRGSEEETSKKPKGRKKTS